MDCPALRVLLHGLFMVCLCFLTSGDYGAVAAIFLSTRKLCVCCNKDDRTEKEAGVCRVIKNHYKKLGPMRFEEAMVLCLFVCLVGLWFFRQPQFMPRWAKAFSPGYTTDAIPALFIGSVLFVLPSRLPWKLGNEQDAHGASPPLMNWNYFQSKMAWGVILLLGGGFALARACQVSGLSALIADKLTVFRNLPGFLLVFILCLMVFLGALIERYPSLYVSTKQYSFDH